MLKICSRPKTNPNFFLISDDPQGVSSGSAPAADEVLPVFDMSGSEGPAVLAGIACYDDSDCALPSVEFASMSGAAAASTAGILNASCLKAGGESDHSDEELGVCMCTYVGGPLCLGATSSEPASIELSEVSSSSDSVVDICMRRSGFDNVRIVKGDSKANLTLVNGTAAGDVTLGAATQSAAAEARAQDVAIGDVVSDGIVMFSAETSPLRGSTYEYDDSDSDSVDYDYGDSGDVEVSSSRTSSRASSESPDSSLPDEFEVTMQSRD